MRKIIVFVGVLSIMATAAIGATSLNWMSDSVSGGTAPDVWDSSGVMVPQGNDWYLQLYDVSDSTFDFDANPTGGELYNANDAFALQAGVTLLRVSEIYPWGSGTTVGTRLFNNSDPAVADEYAVSTLTTTLPVLEGNPDVDPTLTSYNFGDIRQEDWVPEPMTTMLALVGVGTVIYRRRRMRNK